MFGISKTANRVHRATPSDVNRRVAEETQDRLRLFRKEPHDLIEKRLDDLDREWDTERTLQTNFAILSLVGIGLAAKVDRRWSALAMIVPAFMVQHSLQGWCPPLPLLRRLGIRTAKEINEERFGLKSLRGDFDHAARMKDPDKLLRAARR